MKTRLSFKFIIVVLLITVSLMALPATPVLAAASTPNPIDTRLENMLMREKIALNNQAARLANTDEVVDRVEQLIQKYKDQGVDTTELEEALSSYQKGVQAAQGYHDKAASILANPAGFDANGKVIDRKQALETVRTAGNALRRAHLEITEATQDLRLAVRAFIEGHKPAESQP